MKREVELLARPLLPHSTPFLSLPHRHILSFLLSSHIPPLSSHTPPRFFLLRLICFDEIQHSDFGTTVVLERLFSFLVNRGAVILFTSNRPPHQLGASGFSQEAELASASEGGVGDLARLLLDANGVHEIASSTDYRTKAAKGRTAYCFADEEAGRRDFHAALEEALGEREL